MMIYTLTTCLGEFEIVALESRLLSRSFVGSESEESMPSVCCLAKLMKTCSDMKNRRMCGL